MVSHQALPEAVRRFRPTCPGCSATAALKDPARPCSSYDCPGLPADLQVTCAECMYDFAFEDGQVKCDHATCEEALRLESNVPTFRAWLDLLEAESGPAAAVR